MLERLLTRGGHEAADASLPQNESDGGNLKTLNPLESPDWDELLLAHPACSFFHSAEWAAVLKDAYGYEATYFAEVSDGRMVLLLPLMEVTSWLTGKRGVALPFSDICEPILPNSASFQPLFEQVLAFGEQRGWRYIELRTGRCFPDAVGASLWYYEHTLDLRPADGEAGLFASFRSSVRTAIRKALDSGVKVELSGSLDALRDFYRLNCRTRRMHGLPPQPFAFFEHLHRHVLSRKLGCVAVASYKGTPIAADVFFQFGKRAWYKYGASEQGFQTLRANDLVMWEAIRWHAQRGYETLSLGRTDPGHDGLRRFKAGWGARERRIEYFKYDLRKRSFVADTDKVSGWHNRFFRVMPIPLGRAVGAVLYRHMA